jgi:hypothetical protein
MARYEQSYAGERRTAHVGLQLTPTERRELEKAARRRGLGLSEYVRELCFHRPGPVPEIRRNPVNKELINELRAVGNNINQLARIANTVGDLTRNDELDEALGLLRTVIAKVLAL